MSGKIKELHLKASAYLADLEDPSLLLESNYKKSELPEYFKKEAEEIIWLAAHLETES